MTDVGRTNPASTHLACVPDLENLLDNCWGLYDGYGALPFVVRPSIPVLYFGNSANYFASPVKIVTVGLNPSRAEFPEQEWSHRFPLARHLPEDLRSRDMQIHRTALDQYFETKPYKWFGCFEPILNGLSASYYGTHSITALHTDLCSPIATDPTWSRLTREQRSLLQKDGNKAWHSLIGLLTPDVMLISVAGRCLEGVKLPCLTNFEEVYVVARKNPYVLKGRLVEPVNGKRCAMFFGRAAITPFGGVSNVDKLKIGRAIRKWCQLHEVANYSEWES